MDRLIRVLQIEDSRTDTELVRVVLGHSSVAEFTVEAVPATPASRPGSIRPISSRRSSTM